MAVGTIALTNGTGGVEIRTILDITTYGQGTRFVIDDPFAKYEPVATGGFSKQPLIGYAPDFTIKEAFDSVNAGRTIVADSQQVKHRTVAVNLSNFRFEL